MKNFLLLSFIFIFATIFFTSCNSIEIESLLVDQIAIKIKNRTREFYYTNKKFGQYYGETNYQFRNGWQGWTFREQRILSDYEFIVNNKVLDRNTSLTEFYPYKMMRNFSNHQETFFFADSLDLIYLKLANNKEDNNSISFSLKNIVGAESELNKKTKNKISINLTEPLSKFTLIISSYSDFDRYDFSGDELKIYYSDVSSVEIILQIIENDATNEITFSDVYKLINNKKDRLEELLKDSYVKTNNIEFDKALAWAKISLDALITRQYNKGIFAGLPWFNNYWGRDTFISFPGAVLVNGHYYDAKEILLSFSNFQNKDELSEYYGRIPNRVTLTDTIYNTADGTPRFVIEAFNYYKYSNDIDFIRSLFPSIKLATETALQNHTDKYGFLVHKDAETWMDAVGQKGPWSPRGNRANDIQALYYQQLIITNELANIFNDKRLEQISKEAAVKLKTNFNKYFLDERNSLIFDHLNSDDTRDNQIRPNQFIAINTSGFISSSKVKLQVLSNILPKLVYDYGVPSLSQYDDNFHPYHQYPPYYVKDAAYHNGIIWQWLSGPVIESLCNFGLQDSAWKLTKTLTDEILNRGAIGTISELMEALKRNNSDSLLLSGTFSQAWSLAEYTRNFYMNYLGIHPDAPNKTLYIVPSLPKELNLINFKQRIGEDHLLITYSYDSLYFNIIIDASSITDSFTIAVGVLNNASANFQFKTDIYSKDILKISIPSYATSFDDLVVFRNNDEVPVRGQVYLDPERNKNIYNKIKFAEPLLNQNLASLKGPSYNLLKLNDVKKEMGKSKLILNISDEIKDEKYIYPTNPNFKDGILDLKNFKLSEDEHDYHFELEFRQLHNPGWHNEYGFQLTQAAIAIGNSTAEGSVNLGYNSNLILKKERSFDKLIVIGGGIEILDKTGKINHAYIPELTDISDPIGNTKEGIISFSLAKDIIGEIDTKTKISIFIGGQNDNGGGGIGIFRDVQFEPSEWNGGGKNSMESDNIYDILYIN